MENIQYAAVLISEQSRLHLFNHIKKIIENIPFEYDDFYGDHMTINLGPLKKESRHLLGEKVKLETAHFGMSEKCFAVLIGAGGEFSKNEHPHITIAVNRKKGGTMRMSNDLEYWFRMDSIMLEGVIAEVSNNKKSY